MQIDSHLCLPDSSLFFFFLRLGGYIQYWETLKSIEDTKASEKTPCSDAEHPKASLKPLRTYLFESLSQSHTKQRSASQSELEGSLDRKDHQGLMSISLPLLTWPPPVVASLRPDAGLGGDRRSTKGPLLSPGRKICPIIQHAVWYLYYLRY